MKGPNFFSVALLVFETSVHGFASVAYHYDALSRLTGTVYPDGTEVSYTYDAHGNRLSRVVTGPSAAMPTVNTDKGSLSFSGTAGQGSAGGQALAIRNSGGGTLQWNVSSSVTWLAFSVPSGTGDGTVSVSASAQGLQAGTYSGNIVIYASASNTPLTIPVTFTVAKSNTCDFLISPGSETFPAAGGSGAISITASDGCSWTAASSVAWMTLTGPVAGTGNGTVNYSVAANSGSARSGTITAAGLPFDVEQTGASATALRFVPVAPCRVTDTRAPGGPFGGPTMTAGSSRSFAIPQSPCGIPSTAQAYSLNVTVVPQGPLSYLTLWPTGQDQPLVSTLNSWGGTVVANAAIVPAGVNGAVSVFVTNPTDVILDINGYFDSSTSNSYSFYAATPCRVADTRGAAGQFGGPSMFDGQSRDFPVPLSSCSIPPTAKASSLNVTVVPDQVVRYLAYLTTWPTGQPRPNASTLNSWTGKVVANAAIVPTGTNGSVSVYVTNRTDVILDINGYFGLPGSAGALNFYPVAPCRIADTRNSDGPFGGPILEASSMRSFAIPSSACRIPNSAAAYSVNVTVVPDEPLGYLTAWPTGSLQPNVSTLNSWDGSVVANAAIVPAGRGGAISIFVTGQTHVVLDINGYFAP
jgi:YD repeat-containing protein